MNINELLNRYFEGESSLDEERSIKQYFASGDIADEHRAYADLFSCFATESELAYKGEDSIDLLLEKYFEGETEISEEQQLKSYFSSDAVEVKHEIYKDLFSFYTSESEVTYEGADSIDLLLEMYFAGETEVAMEQQLKTYFNGEEIADEHLQYKELFTYFTEAQTEKLEKKIDLNKGRTLHIIRRTMMGIAAGLALLLGSLYVMNLNQEALELKNLTAMEEKKAEEALETTMEALAFLGIQFNKGTESLEQIKNLKKTEIFKN